MFELGLYTKIVITSFVALVGIFLSVLVIRWLMATLRVEADQTESLKLVNQGNCACQYHLSVKSLASDLVFKLYVDGVPLAPVFEEIEEKVVEEKTVVETSAAPARTVAVADAGSQSVEKNTKLNADDALQKGQDANAKVGVFANLLGIVGNLLPGSLGKSVKGAAGSARKAQSTSAKAIQAPKSAQRKVDAMKKSGSRLGVQAGEKPEQRVAQSRSGARKMRGQRQQTEISRSTREVVKTIKKTVEKVGVVQTIDLYPGEFLDLSLEISKAGKRYPTGSFGYSLESQPVPLDKQLGSAPAMIKKRQVHFAPIPRWRYWMPSLSVTLYLLLLALSAYYFILVLWA